METLTRLGKVAPPQGPTELDFRISYGNEDPSDADSHGSWDSWTVDPWMSFLDNNA